jgi:hypothetical protein
MRELPSYDFNRPLGRPSKYPWDKWENGSIWEIVQGEDYEVSTENMQVNLHLRAARDNKKVQTRTERDDGVEKLVFQFYDVDETKLG